MPFGLKNARVIYQRAMSQIFKDFLHKKMKCYVDDLSLESKDRSQHSNDLKEVLECLRKNQYKMNRLKCSFKVTLEKFLGFIV